MKYMYILAVLALGTFLYILITNKSVRAPFFEYISRDKMPIWLSVVFAISAAAGTYVVAPILNQDFEFQKNRSAHLLQTVSDLNKLSIELSIAIRRFNDSLFYNKDDLQKVRGELFDKITELQWRLIDVDVIIKRAGNDDGSVSNLSKKLDNLRAVINEARKPKDQELVISSSIEVAKANRATVAALYKASSLDKY